MAQRSIRFPDDLEAAVEAETARLGHPHTFSSFMLNAARKALGSAKVRETASASANGGKKDKG
jgi:hypothetical protein